MCTTDDAHAAGAAFGGAAFGSVAEALRPAARSRTT